MEPPLLLSSRPSSTKTHARPVSPEASSPIHTSESFEQRTAQSYASPNIFLLSTRCLATLSALLLASTLRLSNVVVDRPQISETPP